MTPTIPALDIITEAELQVSILRRARELGWLAYATRRSDKSEPGFPDVVMVRPPRVIMMELKTQKGRLRKGRWANKGTRWLPGQDTWKQALEGCPGVEYYLIRPSDMEWVYGVLE